MRAGPGFDQDLLGEVFFLQVSQKYQAVVLERSVGLKHNRMSTSKGNYLFLERLNLGEFSAQ